MADSRRRPWLYPRSARETMALIEEELAALDREAETAKEEERRNRQRRHGELRRLLRRLIGQMMAEIALARCGE